MTYTIKKGDTLTSIAREYNTTVDDLAKANGIQNKNLIYAGNTLNIPDNGVRTVTSYIYGEPEYEYSSGYRPDDQVVRAKDSLEKWRSSRPKEYKSSYDSEIQKLMSELDKRRFSYNAESDPVFAAYKSQYEAQGRRAMEDALGKAASRTGGFGNSYAQSAVNQAMGEYLGKLSGVIPELYEAAYKRYGDEGDYITNKIKLLKSMDDSDWKKYNDTLKSYFDEGKNLSEHYRKLSEQDYEKFLDYIELLSAAY